MKESFEMEMDGAGRKKSLYKNNARVLKDIEKEKNMREKTAASDEDARWYKVLKGNERKKCVIRFPKSRNIAEQEIFNASPVMPHE